MAVSDLYGLYAVELASTTVIGGVSGNSINIGSSVVNEPSSGEPITRFQALLAQSPSASFSTMHIASILDELTGSPPYFEDMATPGLRLYAQQRADGGTRAAGSSHLKYTMTECLLMLRSISAEHQGNAVAQLDAIAKYDGTNEPLIPSTSSLPTLVDDTERFTLPAGGVSIGGKTIDQVKSIQIDFGVNGRPEGSDSDIWPTHVGIDSIAPTIRINGIDPAWFSASNIPLQGLSGTHANTTIKLRKRADGGSFVADLTAEHIAFTAAGFVTIGAALDSQGSEVSSVDLLMQCVNDGTNDPITIDTASAI